MSEDNTQLTADNAALMRGLLAWAKAWDATHGKTFLASDPEGQRLRRERDAAEEALRALCESKHPGRKLLEAHNEKVERLQILMAHVSSPIAHVGCAKCIEARDAIREGFKLLQEPVKGPWGTLSGRSTLEIFAEIQVAERKAIIAFLHSRTFFKPEDFVTPEGVNAVIRHLAMLISVGAHVAD